MTRGRGGPPGWAPGVAAARGPARRARRHAADSVSTDASVSTDPKIAPGTRRPFPQKGGGLACLGEDPLTYHPAMLLLNAILVIIYTIFGAVICMVLVTSAVYFVRQGGYLTWIPIALWFGCPAWGLWQGNDPVERMMWMGAGCMLGCGILLEVAPPEWWWRRNDDDVR